MHTCLHEYKCGALNSTHYVRRPLSCEMQMYDIITAVLGSAVAHMTRKWCDCAIHESEVWTWYDGTHMTKVFVKEQSILL